MQFVNAPNIFDIAPSTVAPSPNGLRENPSVCGAMLFNTMRTRICGIYKITNPKGKVYIGQSIDIYTRWRNYNNKNFPFKQQRHLTSSIKKYGIDSHRFETVRECNESMLNHWESYYIYFFDSLSPQGLNLKEGGSNGRHSEETKIKIGLSNKGKKMSLWQKQYLSKIGKERIRSEEEKSRLRNLNHNKNVSLATRAKLSACFKGKPIHENTRKAVSAANKIRVRTLESRGKLSKSLKEFYKNNPKHKKENH
jgi:group I intron endonuclease